MNALAKLAKPVLVLNKSWTAIGTVTLEDAISKLYSTYHNGEPKAFVVEPESYQRFSWADWGKFTPSITEEVIRSSNMAFRIPEIILLSRYEKLPQPKIHFSRRTLYKRDNFTCSYCVKKFKTEILTVDHILPKSRGGKTTWENCCLACYKCNMKKANRTPEEAGMKLHITPSKPKNLNMYKFNLTKPIKSWQSFISEYYWNVSIEEE
jgi:5-methylcytosine-specific restriction endonuclease McrA